MAKLKVAFAGFRHGHIIGLYEKVKNHPDLELVAAAEEDAAARAALGTSNPGVVITHDNIEKMLDEVPCDIVAIGDYYTIRGARATAALKRGKHIIADKPLCTSLDELAEIEKLAAEKKLSVGCMFDLRVAPSVNHAVQIVKSGKLGKITQIQFTAQHPLLRGTRPAWYFENNQHGGTINDIGSHAADLLPYMLDTKIKSIVGARSWKALARPEESIDDAGQFILEMADGCGVTADVSYVATDSLGYSLPTYWRFNIWGSCGMIEFSYTSTAVKAYINGESEAVEISNPPVKTADYLEEFLNEISGRPGKLTTESIIEAARWILKIQKCADNYGK